MSKRVGYLRQTWLNIKKTLLVTNQKEVYVGRDEHGNKYFEKPEVPEKDLKMVRRVEPEDPDQFKVPTVPVEWMTWLQGRRKFPPSPEELEENYMTMLRTQHRAKQLKNDNEDLQENVQSTPSDTKKVAFPTYEDYEIHPGEFNKKKNDEHR